MQQAAQAHPNEPRPGQSTLSALAAGLAQGGDRPAIIAFRHDARITWSYAELARRVEARAAALLAAGLIKGDVLALVAENQPDWIVTALAGLRSGIVVAPVDAEQDDGTLEHILRDSGAKLVAVSTATADRLNDLATAPARILIDKEEAEPLHGNASPAANAGPGDVAILFYTSGTTGAPKGVPLTHANLAFQLNALVETGIVGGADRLLLPLPFHHVFPFVVGILAPLHLKLPIVLPRALTGTHLATALREGGVTVVVGVPRLYGALIDGLRARAAARGRLSAGLFDTALGWLVWLRRRTGARLGRALIPLHRRLAPDLRLLVSGGAALDADLALKLEGLGWMVATGYGLTETSPILTWNVPGAADFATAGRPIPGVELKIDPIALAEGQQAPDEAKGERYGEILARGPGIFSGYLRLPEKTTAAFGEDGWFRTGDTGFIDRAGYLHILGRANTMLVTEGGKNIAPETVEEAYLGAPAIREIAVLKKEGRLVALVVPELRVTGHGDDMQRAVEAAIRERSRALPSYQRISAYAITKEPIPRTRIGKPKRHLLAEQFDRARREPKDHAAKVVAPIEPRHMSPEDRRLLRNGPAHEVWHWLAARYPDRRLTPDSSPQLDLDIDSVEWLTITLEIGRRTGVELTEEAIERVQTVRDLLREVAEASEAGQRFNASMLDDPEAQLSEDQKVWLAPIRGFAFHVGSLLHKLNWIIARLMFRLRVEGRDRLPDGQVLLAPTHGSVLDPFVLAAALDRGFLADTFWVGDAEMAFGNRLTRSVSRLAQAMPIDTRKGFLSGMALAAAALRRGHKLIWFPEGQRARDDAVQDLMPGIGILLAHHPVPVVPVAIHGAHRAYPPGRYLPRPGQVRVIFGAPIDPGELGAGAAGDRAAQAITDALRARLVTLFETTR